MRNVPWEARELQFIHDNYQSMTNKEIAEFLGRSKTAVDLKVNRLGLKKSKYTYNHDFFENIDTEDKAYWLGFIYADGCVSHVKRSYAESYELSIKLQARDHTHLKKFNVALKGNVDVAFFDREAFGLKKYKQCQIRIYSKKVVQDLGRWGVIPNKSLVKQFPSLPIPAIPHFIRGYFDGNGCICLDKRRGLPSIDFTTGSHSFVTSLREVLYAYGVSSYICQEKLNTFRLYVRGMENSDRFLRFIYDNATVYLDRKLQKKTEIYENQKIAQRLLR